MDLLTQRFGIGQSDGPLSQINFTTSGGLEQLGGHRNDREEVSGDVENTKGKCAAEPRGLDSARVVTVIETQEEVGHGTPEDPFRIVAKYWGLNGELLGKRVVQ